MDCSRRVRIGTKPGICVATGRFEVAKNRELRGEEERGRWRRQKARATGQRTIIREMELARAINGGEGVEKFWSWRFNSEDEDEPSKSPHRQRCLRTGSGIGTEVPPVLLLGAMPCTAHVPGRFTAGQRRLLIGSLIDLPPILKQPFAGRGMFSELRSGQRGRQLQPRSGWPLSVGPFFKLSRANSGNPPAPQLLLNP